MKRVFDKKYLMDRVPAVILVAAISSFSTITLYIKNINEITFGQFFPVVCVFLFIGFSAYLACCFILKQHAKAALMTMWLMLVFCNLGMIVPFLPSDYHKIYIAIGILLIALSIGALFLLKKLTSEIFSLLCLSFAITFSVLILYNVSLGFLNLGKHTETSLQHVMETDPESHRLLRAANNASGDRPNMYFLIFDEYAGFDELQSRYGFDNSQFYQTMKDKGFSMVRGCTNEYAETLRALGDILNLRHIDYSEIKSNGALRYLIKNGIVFDMLYSMGYELYETEAHDLFDLQPAISQLPSLNIPMTENGTTFLQVFFQNTAIGPIYYRIERMLYSVPEPGDTFPEIATYYKNMSKPESPTVHFFYECLPHAPFYFDEHGNRIDAGMLGAAIASGGNCDWTDPDKYLGQLKYVSNNIVAMCQNIIENDPDCIIILMSDHGARNQELQNPSYDRELAKVEQLDILMGIYYRGEPMEGLEGMSGVNIIRKIFNATFKTELEMLDYWNDGHLTDTIGRRMLGLV